MTSLMAGTVDHGVRAVLTVVPNLPVLLGTLRKSPVVALTTLRLYKYMYC